jgi:hypothetical protein
LISGSLNHRTLLFMLKLMKTTHFQLDFNYAR